MKLHGKVAVVTGGLRGIGQAIALAMAGEGAEILIASRSIDGAGPTEQAIQALGRRCVALQTDVSDADAVQRMIAVTVQHFGGSTFWSTTPVSPFLSLLRSSPWQNFHGSWT
jgi:NAD(P)-dependent dehydrogenase (short-subunit alcohol dehydrogenase family)